MNMFNVLGIDSSADVIGVAAIAALDFISFSDTLPAVQLSHYNQACAIFVNGRTRCWGMNDSQQLGENVHSYSNRGSATNPMAGAIFVTFSASINTIPIIQVATGR
jgi:hypothetical protein